MKRHAIIIWMVSLGLPTAALATCTVVSPAARFCESDAAAAMAFLRAQPGSRPDLVAAEATKRLLEPGGCIRAGINAADLDIREIAQHPVVLPEGPVPVLSVLIDGATDWYVAAGFLEGVCARK